MTDFDTVTTLNAGTGGDDMDESQVYEDNASGVPTAAGKRPRVVIGGETKRDSIVEPIQDGDKYSLPTVDGELRHSVSELLAVQHRILDLLEMLVAAALSKAG